MGYSDKVLDHYENPKNVGTLDKDDENVGTGLVGAPACLHGDTLVAVADGFSPIPIRDLAERGEDVLVYAYSVAKERMVVRRASNIRKTSVGATVVKVTFTDGTYLICTPDHLLRMAVRKQDWLTAGSLQRGYCIMPFARLYYKEDVHYIATDPLEVDDLMYGDVTKTVRDVELTDYSDVYCMEVEEDANFAVILKDVEGKQSGIIVHNCGDVLRLQLKINPETEVIEEAKFKTFGCVASNTHIAAPGRSLEVSKVEVGSLVCAWDGENISTAEVVEVTKRPVHIDDIRRVQLESGYILVTKDHIFMRQDGTPVEAEDAAGELLYSLPGFQSGLVDSVQKIVGTTSSDHTLWKLERGGSYTDRDVLIMYDLKLSGPHVYFTYGIASHNCGSAIAASSLVTEWVQGKTIEEASSIKNTQIVEELSLPPVKIHCSVLAEDAIKSAIADFRKKQKAKKSGD